MFRHQTVTDADLVKATLYNRSRLTESGCWVWVRGKRAQYGLFAIRGKTVGAHRASYEAFKGEIPAGLVVRHTCDNPSCINPGHLILGTQKDNARDRMERGRGHVLKGENIATAKLTAEQVREIRASVHLSLREIASKYGIDKSNAWSIRTGKSWKHVKSDAMASSQQGD